MNRLSRVGLACALSATLAGVARAQVACSDDAICKVGVAPKGAKTLVAAGALGSAGLWAIGAKGQAWLRGDAGFGAAVKTGAKQDLLAGAPLGGGLIAVGKAGTAVRWDGKLWTALKPAVKKDLAGVWAAGDHAWAVGKAGTIVAWDGTRWKPEPSGVKVDLRGIWGSREGDLWAVGDGGTILHSDGTSWTTSRTGNAKLTAVMGTAPDSVWAIGQLGAVLHWDGKGWFSIKVGMAGDLLTPFFIAPADIVFLGDGGNGVRFRRNDWDNLTAGEASFVSAAVVQGTSVILAADGAIWEYAGGWSEQPSPTGENGIDTMAQRGDSLVVAGDGGKVARLDKGKWSQLDPEPPHAMNNILGVSFDGKDVLALDYDGHVMRLSDGKPPELSLPFKTHGVTGFNAMYLASHGIGFAVGCCGMIYRWDGKTWTEAPSPLKETFEAVWGPSGDAVWAVGDSGSVAFWDGKTWTKQLTPASENLESIWAASPSSAVIVGSSVVLMWDGAAWNRVDPPFKGLLRSVCGRAADELYVGGNNGQIARWDGKRWTVQASPTNGALRSCAVRPDGQVVFGDQNGGLILHDPFARAGK